MTALPASLRELAAHLEAVAQDGTVPLDTDLLRQCCLIVSTPEYNAEVWKQTQPLFLQTAALLPQLQQDPSPLTHFVAKLAQPYRFEDIKDVDFETALDLQATPFHALVLSLLEKATLASADALALANRPGVMSAMVRLWLCTHDPGIATRTEDLLVSLLKVSKNEPIEEGLLHVHGSGPMWRRLFSDRDIRSLYYYYTSLTQLSTPDLSKRDKTLAQARLLSWLPRVGAMDWATLVTPHHLDVERELGLGDQGLLHYATEIMVDTEDDILMHMTLIKFFSTLITTVKTRPHLTHYNSSLSLDFVRDQGIHKKLVDLYISETPGVEQSFLSSRLAQYISDYASHYPENFENSPEMPAIRDHVHRSIRKCEASDLNVIASMPRSTLVPQRSGFAWDECLLLDLPITRTNANALKTLATVLNGPPKEHITFPHVEAVGIDHRRTQMESTFARLIAGTFCGNKSSMFSDLISHMEAIAMKENALAALGVVHALITATWSSEPIPGVIPADDPVFARLKNFPHTGLELVIDPSISGGLLPFLLKPATSFSNLVGGRGDAENAAYQVAMAKFDVLEALGRRLEEDQGRQDVLAMVKRRISEGPWGTAGSVGSRIGTLEL